MQESVFTRAFSYRERENHSPLENYLIEIFAWCLENDSIFLFDFLSLFNYEKPKDAIKINTQIIDIDNGKPDIEICYDDFNIIIECKVESGEGNEQLLRYNNILNKRKQNNRILIYLTKFYVEKKGDYWPLRWFQISNIISKKNNFVTQQLKQFLKDKKMENVQTFSIEDLMALKVIPGTLSKMEELFEQLQTEFINTFGNYRREKQLIYNNYNCYSTLKNKGSEYYVAVGFWNGNENEDVPYFGLWINLPKKLQSNNFFIKLKDNLVNNGWYIDENGMPIIKRKLTSFIYEKGDSLPEMKKFVIENLLLINNILKVKH